MKNKLIATRTAFGEALAEMAKERNNIVVLDADVVTSTKTSIFREAFPERFFEMGIVEQIENNNLFNEIIGLRDICE